MKRKQVEDENFDQAIKIYNTLLSRPDTTPLDKRLVFFNLGVIHHRNGQESLGLAYWQDSVAIPFSTSDPLLEAEETELAAAANMNIGAHYVLQKDIIKGMGYLQRAVELDPDDGEIRFNLAATLAGIGKPEDAIREFEAAEQRGIKTARDVINKIKAGMAKSSENPEKE
jgi:tetratricopeptide (TPR) repeat protein